MAFQGFIGPNTYSTVDEIMFIKGNHTVRFTLDVWSDNTKTTLLSQRTYNLHFSHYYETLKGIDISDPPASGTNNDRYFISATPTGEWVGHEKQFAVWQDDANEGAGGWTYWFVSPDWIYYNEADQKYYRILTDQGDYEEADKSVTDRRIWDAHFAPEHTILNEESNIMKQIYLWLKTQPGFESVTDV